VQTFTITVAAVNDAPSFVRGSDQTVSEEPERWRCQVGRRSQCGPADEAGQTLAFTATNDNNALFSVQRQWR